MFCLIGLAHRAQSRRVGDALSEAQRTYVDCLCQTIVEVHPTLIAEEDSQEALADRQQISLAEEIADQRGIEHRFCDPTQEERRLMGYRDGQSLEIEIFMRDRENLTDIEIRNRARAIEIARYFPMREEFWLQQLDGCLGRDVIFICGDAHIEGFSNLLERRGVQFRIIQRGIGLTVEDEWLEDVLRYLREHPEIAED